MAHRTSRRCGLLDEDGFIGLKRFLGCARGRQDVAAELVERHRLGIRLDALIEHFKRRRDGAALPVGFCTFNDLSIGKTRRIIRKRR